MDKKTINTIVWWIPFKKTRNAVRKYLLSAQCREITSLEVSITTKCTLRCVNCHNLNTHYYISKYNKEPSDSNIDDVIESLKLFLQNIDMLAEFNIMGGEPFMHKELYKLVNFASTNQKIYITRIVTNGTLIPTGDNMHCLKNKNVQVDISDYGNISNKKYILKENFEKENIKFLLHNNGKGGRDESEKWIDAGEIFFRNRTTNEILDIFTSCTTQNCKHMLNGKIYGCPRIAHAHNLDIYEPEDTEFIDLNIEDKNISKKIGKLYYNTKYYNFCNYCDGTGKHSKKVAPAIQLD